MFIRKTYILRLLFAAIFLTHLFAIPSFAEENPNDEIEKLDPVVVTGQTIPDTQPEDDISAFGEVVLVDDLPGVPLTLSEALESLTGLNIRDFGGLGKLSTLTMRGFSPGNVLIMLNGIPLNSSALGGFDLSDINLGSIEKIKVIRGSEAALYGNNSAAGIVNLITRPEESSSDFNLEVASHGLISSTFSFVENNDEIRKYLIFSGTGYEGGFPFLNDNGTTLDVSDDFPDSRDNNEIESFGFTGGIQVPLDDWDLFLDTDARFSAKGIPGLVTFPTPNAEQKDDREFGKLSFLNQNMASGNGSLRFDLSYLRTSREYHDPDGGVTGFPTHSEWTERAFSAGMEYSEFIGDDHYIVTGLDFGVNEFASLDSISVERDELGIYIRDEIAVGKSLIIPAIRFDHIESIGSKLSPKLGWRTDLTDRIVLKANYGSGFRAPTFVELYRDEGFVVGTPDLDPETSWTADAGFIYADDTFRLEADMFISESSNLIEYVLGSGHRYHPLNFGKARMHGVECSMKWIPDDEWEISSNFSWISAKDRTDEASPSYGKQIPGRPEWDAFCGVAYSPTAENYSIDVGGYFAGGRYITAANTKKLDDDASFNLAITIPLNCPGHFAFEIKNIFDSGLVDARGFPLPGRIFVAGINLEV